MKKRFVLITILTRSIGMASALFVALAMTSVHAQTNRSNDNCAEKKRVLVKFEAAAPKIRTLLAKANLVLGEMEEYRSHEPSLAQILKWSRETEDVMAYDLDSDLPVLPTDDDEFMELFDPRSIDDKLKDIKNSPAYIDVKRQQLGLEVRRDYVAHQISLIRDSIDSLGCGGVLPKTNSTFDAVKYPFFKETKTWDLSLTNESISLSNGRSETKIFRLKTVGNEYNNSIKATLSNAVPLSSIFGSSWMGSADFNCDANFDNDILAFDCGTGAERGLFTGRFTVTIVECVVPKLNGTLSYAGGYLKPARQWTMKGQLDWEPTRPPNC